MRSLLLLPALLVLVCASAPSIANEKARDAYADLIESIASDEMAAQEFEVQMAQAPEVWAKDPDFIELDQECPGFIEGYSTAIRPSLLKGHLDDYAWYRVQLNTLLRAELSPEEAAQGAQFFNSPLGRKLVTWAWANTSIENVTAEAIESPDGTVSSEAFDADREATRERLKEDYSFDDLAAIKEGLGEGFGPKLLELKPKINAITLEMYNREYSPEIEAEIEETSDRFIDAHITACDAN